MDSGCLNIRDFGAMGDGRTDDTVGIQKALDAAGEVQGSVFVPPGEYLTSRLVMHSNTGLLAQPAWSYNRDPRGAILRLGDAGAPCLLDLTGAIGVTVNGLCLAGPMRREELDRPARRGGAHGIMFDKPGQGEQEDFPRIERCRISNFPGDAIHLGRIWCWSVRHCLCIFNGGNALFVEGFDGFAVDNWFSSNGGAGIFTEQCGACTTITANRIEWNRRGGIRLRGCKHYNITGNFIDRSGGPAIHLASTPQRGSEVFTITGNILWRSGRPEWTAQDGYESCQALLEDTAGLTFVGNSLNVWRDDGPRGRFSPRFGIVCRHLESGIIKDNALHGGALERLLVDLGGHGPGVILADNPGSLFDPTGR